MKFTKILTVIAAASAMPSSYHEHRLRENANVVEELATEESR